MMAGHTHRSSRLLKTWRPLGASSHLVSLHSLLLATPPGFGLPNRRKRVFLLASLHGDARDVLLAQVGAVQPTPAVLSSSLATPPRHACYPSWLPGAGPPALPGLLHRSPPARWGPPGALL
jgi:hypothetical protein